MSVYIAVAFTAAFCRVMSEVLSVVTSTTSENTNITRPVLRSTVKSITSGGEVSGTNSSVWKVSPNTTSRRDPPTSAISRGSTCTNVSFSLVANAVLCLIALRSSGSNATDISNPLLLIAIPPVKVYVLLRVDTSGSPLKVIALACNVAISTTSSNVRLRTPLLMSSANPSNDGLSLSAMNLDTWMALLELMACNDNLLKSRAEPSWT